MVCTFKTHIDDDGRVCTACGVYKKWPVFVKDKDKFYGYKAKCKKCIAAKEKGKYRCPAKRKNSNLLHRYGITLEDYNQMLIDQHYGCKICGISPEEHGRNLVVDHCHTTEEVRGLLCHQCNTAIGLFKEDLRNFRKAMQYLTPTQSGLEQPSGLEEFAN